MALRFDIARLDAPKRDHNGYLETDASVTRVGVFIYRHPDGSVTRELRHPDEVFKADSLQTLRNRPVTLRHPTSGRVDSKNTRHVAVGTAIGDIDHDDRFVRTKIQIVDEDAIAKVLDAQRPLREVSCGYDAEVVPSDGVWQGEHYDHVQKNIVYNHIALVERGRAGPEVRVTLDAEDAVLIEDADINETEDWITVKLADATSFPMHRCRTVDVPGEKGVQAVFVRHDESEQEFVSRCMSDPEKVGEFPDEKQRAAVCFDKFRARKDSRPARFVFEKSAGWDLQRVTKWVEVHRHDAIDEPMRTEAMKLKIKRDAVNTKSFKSDAFTVELDGTPEGAEKAIEATLQRYDEAIAAIRRLEADKDNLQGRIDAMQDGNKVSVARLHDLVKERSDALAAAHYLGCKDYDHLETDELKKLVVLKAYPNMKTDDITADYVQGRYDAVIAHIREENKNVESLANLKRVAANPHLFDKDHLDDKDPRTKLLEDTQDWHKMSQEEIRKATH